MQRHVAPGWVASAAFAALLLCSLLPGTHTQDVAIAGKWQPAEYIEGPGGKKPPRPVLPPRDKQTVHVLISSYRDRLCGRTLFELFNHAERPDLLSVGIVEQFKEGDPRCIQRYCDMMKEAGKPCDHTDRIRIKAVPAGTANGPMHARSFSHEMLQDEEFCLQVDSHSTATNKWDARLIAEWAKAQNEYAVISTYMQRVEDMSDREVGSNVNNWHEVPIMCDTVRGMYGIVRNAQAYAARRLTRPLRSCFWGAGLSFSKCHAERRVPHDPVSQGVFDGEEFTRAIRLWTHGYDLYAPSRSILFHDYTRSQSDPKRWRNQGGADVSYARLKGMLGLPGSSPRDMGQYGLGAVRSKAQYESFCNLDLASGPLGKAVTRCGKLPWVPFKESDMLSLPGVPSGGAGQAAKTGDAASEEGGHGESGATKEADDLAKKAQAVHGHRSPPAPVPWPAVVFVAFLLVVIAVQFSPKMQFWCRYVLRR